MRFFRPTIAVCLAAAFATLPLRAQEGGLLPRRAVLIIDASASMARELDGTPKIDLAKKALRELLRTWDATISLGLMAYGHRAKADCKDIELLVPPEFLNQEKFFKALDTLQPKGITPLTAAVRQAAEALDYTAEPATIILLTDGIDTCGGEPCDAVRELARKGAGLRIHVIGFGMRAEELSTIDCLATETGGQALAAASAEELLNALRTVALAGTSALGILKAPEISGPGAAGVLELQTLSDEGGSPVAATYAIRNTTDPTSDSAVKNGVGPKFFLSPGSYTVEAKWGRARVAADVQIRSGQTLRKTLVLSAGTLVLSARLAGTSQPLRVMYQVYQARASNEERPDLFASNGSGRFRLPEGQYFVGAEWSGVQSPLTGVEIHPNLTTETSIVIEGGILKIETRAADGGEILRPHYTIATLGQEAETIASGGMDPSGFRLPVGKYKVQAAWGEAKAAVETEVRRAETTSLQIVLNAAVLVLKARGPGGFASRVTFSIEQPAASQDAPREVVDSGGAREFRIPAGKYVVVARTQDAEGEILVDVAPGDRKEYEVPIR